MGGWARAVLVVGIFATVLAIDRDAHPCGAGAYAVEIVLPPEGNSVMPLDAALVAAVYESGSAPPIVLRSLDGEDVPIEVELQTDVHGSTALLVARPSIELDPSTAYVWEVDGSERPFRTGSALDDGLPTFEELSVVASQDHVVSGQCGEELAAVDHVAQVLGVSEPVATVAKRLWDGEWAGLEIAAGDELLLRNDTSQAELCFEVSIVDHAGHVVPVGEHCVPMADGEPEPPAQGEEGSTGGEEGSTGGAEGSTGGDDALAEDSLGDRGCACTAAQRRPGAWFVLFGFVVVLASPGLVSRCAPSYMRRP